MQCIVFCTVFSWLIITFCFIYVLHYIQMYYVINIVDNIVARLHKTTADVVFIRLY